MATKNKASAKSKLPAKKVIIKKVVSKKAAPKKAQNPVVKAKPLLVKKITNATKTTIVAKNSAPKKPIVKVVAKVLKKEPVKKTGTKKVIVLKPKNVVKSAVKSKKASVVKKVAKVASVNIITNPIVKKVVAVTQKPIVVQKAIKEFKQVAVKPEKKIKLKAAKLPPAKKIVIAPITFKKEESAASKLAKEPNGKFEMEFVIRASEDMVYEFVSTESGLSEWFCDDVNIRNGVFTFDWDGQQQEAKLVKEVPPQLIRYQWLDNTDGSYFEFRIQKDELTNDISLMITDFAIDKKEEESARLLWHSQVDKLLHVLGSFF